MRSPWFQVWRECLCGDEFRDHPNSHCVKCPCIKFIEDTMPYPMGEVITS